MRGKVLIWLTSRINDKVTQYAAIMIAELNSMQNLRDLSAGKPTAAYMNDAATKAKSHKKEAASLRPPYS